MFTELFENKTYDITDCYPTVLTEDVVVVFDNLEVKMFDIQGSKKWKKEKEYLCWEYLEDVEAVMADIEFGKKGLVDPHFYTSIAPFNCPKKRTPITEKDFQVMCRSFKKWYKDNKIPEYDTYFVDSKNQTYMKF